MKVEVEIKNIDYYIMTSRYVGEPLEVYILGTINRIAFFVLEVDEINILIEIRMKNSQRRFDWASTR